MDRIDKVVAGLTGMTRKEVHKVLAAGRVSVDGVLLKKSDAKIDPETQMVALDGCELIYKKYRYFILNKPSGLLTASTDKKRETVMDLFSGEPHYDRLFPVGRLDKDTTGLLLVTDDGEYAHRVISPKSGVEKEYVAIVDTPISDSAKDEFAKGIVLADGTKCLPAELRITNSEGTQVEIVVFEGKYHQIKRMLGVVGAGVVALHRKRIANLILADNLPNGEYVEITREEAYSVFE